MTTLAVKTGGPKSSAALRATGEAPELLSPATWRLLGLFALAGGVVTALLGAARLSPPAGAIGGVGGAATAWQSRPSPMLFCVGVTMMLVAMAVLRRNRQGVGEGAGEEGSTHALCLRLFSWVRAVHSGLPGAAEPEAGLTPALDVLASARAPADDPAYLLWLKLQLDPLLDEIYPAVMATRDSFRKRHGLPAFAELFGELARAERLLCRAWSAAVDGYADESRDALLAAVEQIAEAEKTLGGIPLVPVQLGR